MHCAQRHAATPGPQRDSGSKGYGGWRTRLLAIVGLLGGFALTVGLVLSQGVGDVWRAIAVLGWSGLLILIVLRVIIVGGMGLAWWRLWPELAPSRFVWARLLRDAAGDTLPLSQLGGYVVGVRAAALAGVAWRSAAATTVVDVTLELIAQLAYVVIGLTLLAWLRPDTAVVWPALLIVASMAAFVALFVALQARGAGTVERLGRRLTRVWLGDGGPSNDIQAVIAALYRRPGRCLPSTALHLGCWVLSGIDTWITLRLIAVPRDLSAAVVIDSLLYGLRSLAFLVPNALGVQEGGFVLFGGLFGVTPEAALALSLIRRARDLVVNAPVLLVWQGLEGRHALRHVPSAHSDIGQM